MRKFSSYNESLLTTTVGSVRVYNNIDKMPDSALFDGDDGYGGRFVYSPKLKEVFCWNSGNLIHRHMIEALANTHGFFADESMLAGGYFLRQDGCEYQIDLMYQFKLSRSSNGRLSDSASMTMSGKWEIPLRTFSQEIIPSMFISSMPKFDYIRRQGSHVATTDGFLEEYEYMKQRYPNL